MITSLKRAIKDRSLNDLNSLVIKARSMIEVLKPQTWTLQAHFKSTLSRAEACIEHLNKQNDVEKRLDEILVMDPYEKNDLYKEFCPHARSSSLRLTRSELQDPSLPWHRIVFKLRR